MNGKEYQDLAMRTCSIPYDQKEDMLRHAVFGLASEAGEVAGIMQKVYQGHPFDKEHLKKELGDCVWSVSTPCLRPMQTALRTCRWRLRKSMK